jgi:arylsulfatase A-like enzyme
VLLDVRDTLNKFLPRALLSALALFVFFSIIRWGTVGITFGVKNVKRITILILVTLFFAVGWSANHFVLPHKFHTVSIAFNLLFTLLCLTIGLLVVLDRESPRRLRAVAKPVFTVISWLGFLMLLAWGQVNMPIVIKQLPPDSSHKNIIIVVVDCLRYDHISHNGYERKTTPFLDGIEKDSIVFDNAYSHCSWTKPSIAALFTSKLPLHHTALFKYDVLPKSELVMAEILRNSGYATAFLNDGNFVISDKFQFQQGFDYYVDTEMNGAKGLTDIFIDKLPGWKESGPFFTYVHYMDAHTPYTPNSMSERFVDKSKEHILEVGRMRTPYVDMLAGYDWIPEYERGHVVDVYDGQLSFVDKSISRIMRALDEQGIIDNTIVMITADHGEEFWDHGGSGHGQVLYQELIHVPLIITGGGVKARHIERRVRLIDMLPTLLALADIDSPDRKFAGINVLSDEENAPNDDLPLFAISTLYGNMKYCFIDGENKLIYGVRGSKIHKPLSSELEPERFELYNLSDDPGETKNLYTPEQGDSEVLKTTLITFLNQSIKGKKSEELEPDEETKRRLKSLGYIQ